MWYFTLQSIILLNVEIIMIIWSESNIILKMNGWRWKSSVDYSLINTFDFGGFSTCIQSKYEWQILWLLLSCWWQSLQFVFMFNGNEYVIIWTFLVFWPFFFIFICEYFYYCYCVFLYTFSMNEWHFKFSYFSQNNVKLVKHI